MPSSFVCVLHSGSGVYPETLVGNALQCLHALQRSVRAAAPDFIPSVAVFLADPVHGVECVYSSAVPDRNHAVERVAATFPTLADAGGSAFCADDDDDDDNGNNDGGGPESQARRAAAFAQLFRLRSPLLLQQAVLRAVQARNTAAAAACAANTGRDGLAAVPSTAIAAGEADTWGPLAGALLASLAFLRAHSSSAGQPAGDGDADGEAAQGSSAAASGGGASAPTHGAGSTIVVFSDVRTDAVPPYSAECALATATVVASRRDVVVSCFGDAVVRADTTENRLVSLASSLGGFCAARFSLADLGQLLDGASGLADGGQGGSRSRQKRDRITSQYVVGPTMLPRPTVDSASPRQAVSDDGGRKKKAKVEAEADTAAVPCQRASHLGWLCPSCMAVMYRDTREGTALAEAPAEAKGTERREEGGGEPGVAPTCPYCSVY